VSAAGGAGGLDVRLASGVDGVSSASAFWTCVSLSLSGAGVLCAEFSFASSSLK
jgi:hypothetical protein